MASYIFFLPKETLSKHQITDLVTLSAPQETPVCCDSLLFN